MRHISRAVFTDRAEAQQALDALHAAGYPDSDATLATEPAWEQAERTDEHKAPAWLQATSTTAGKLLDRMFGYEEASDKVAGRGAADTCTLTLETDSDDDDVRAASLVPALRRIDSGDPAQSASEPAHARPRPGYRHGTEPGALQNYARDASHFFGTREVNDLVPGGSTFREHMMDSEHWLDPDVGQYDPAGAAAGSPGDDAAARAAYRFGHDMHQDARFRNRSWSEADTALEALWNARSPDGGRWEESSAAVRLGWDSTSPEIDDDDDHRSHWKTSYVRRPAAGDAQFAQSLFKRAPGADPASVWKRRHPGEPPPWERFVDALRSGWSNTKACMDVDEAGYRRHHAARYPGTDYKTLAPVYRYGRNVRDRAGFRGRSWDEVESELRAEWERGCGEGNASSWDEMKDAVHEGWEHGSPERQASAADDSH